MWNHFWVRSRPSICIQPPIPSWMPHSEYQIHRRSSLTFRSAAFMYSFFSFFHWRQNSSLYTPGSFFMSSERPRLALWGLVGWALWDSSFRAESGLVVVFVHGWSPYCSDSFLSSLSEECTKCVSKANKPYQTEYHLTCSLGSVTMGVDLLIHSLPTIRTITKTQKNYRLVLTSTTE